jgi:large repetitive protein
MPKGLAPIIGATIKGDAMRTFRSTIRYALILPVLGALAAAPLFADAPLITVKPATYLTMQDQAIVAHAPGVLADAYHSDGRPLTAVLVASPESGTVTLEPDGGFTYTPMLGWAGSDAFTFKASDGMYESDSATISILVSALNQAPVANPINFSMMQGTTLQVSAPGVLVNDWDPDGDQLYAILVEAPFNGAFMLNYNGSLTYTPEPEFYGEATFVYQAMDGELYSNYVTVEIRVERAPVAAVAADLDFQMLEDGTLQVSAADGLMSNGYDPEGIFGIVPAIVVEPLHGELTLAEDGGFMYVPAADYNGFDSFVYELQDAYGETTAAVVGIQIIAVNDAPSFTPGANVVVDEDAGFVAIKKWATEISAGPANEAYQAVWFEVHVIEGAYLFAAMPQVDNAGHLTFEVAPAVWGTALMHIQLLDDGGTENGGLDASEILSFEITVNPINDAPSFVGGGDVIVLEDAGMVQIGAWARDMRMGTMSNAETLMFLVTVHNNAGIFDILPQVDAESGELTFRGAPDAFGLAEISVALIEVNGDNKLSPHQSFRINILPVNDAPSFNAGHNITHQTSLGEAEIPHWATQISAGPANEADQQLSFIVTVLQGEDLFEVAPAIDAEGTLRFTPAAAANGLAMMQVVLTDDGGTENGGVDTSMPVTFTIQLQYSERAQAGSDGGCASGNGNLPWLALGLLGMLAAVRLPRRARA